MNNHRFYKTLVQRYLDNTASKEELEVFFHLLQEGKLDSYLREAGRQTNPQPKLARVIRFSIAAAFIFTVSTGIYFFLNNKGAASAPTATVQNTIQPQAAPGGKKAVLTLSDGRQLDLEKVAQTIHDGSAEIIPNNEGLVYQSASGTTPLYNTITTPKGGEYQLTLPDGSQVWLNAESSLHYPTAFTGAERIVTLTGEAYFEIAKKNGQPFIVQAKNAAVKVLGTHFNVMAYNDEPFLKTTLEEGAVLVQQNGRSARLSPGQGGTIANGSDNISVEPANVEQDLAWKNGKFYFNKTELETIMKQIGRWYDLDIHYAGPIPKKRFVGKISRHTNLSDVLDVLRLSEVKFSMTGRTLTVQE